MTRNTSYTTVCLVGALGLLAPVGCGSVCGDDGFVWQQAGNPACLGADSQSDAASATENTGTGPDSATVDPPTTSDTEPTVGVTQGGGMWCADGDGDGFGDPSMCQPDEFPGSVPNDDDCDDTNKNAFPGSAENESDTACMEDEDGDGFGDGMPGPGIEPGTDCDDGNANAFPGSAENESDTKCMEDEDGDGYGDDEPGPGIEPGTDCDDANVGTFPGAAENDSADMCMQDEDGDGYGDPTPTDPDVPAGTDCDDSNPNTFPGAAPNNSPDACMNDDDGDDWGDDDVPEGVEPGTDCDDESANTFPGAAPNDAAEACMRDEDGDDWGDDEPPEGVIPGSDCSDADVRVHDTCEPCEAGTSQCVADELIVCSARGNVKEKTVCEHGCDDEGKKCWEILTVEAGETVCVDAGQSTQLLATAMGGDGTYTWDWTPADTLSDAAVADPMATPVAPTTYTVNVSDGEGNMAADNVTVYINNLTLELSPELCETYDFPWAVDAPTNWVWNEATKTLCQTVNGKPSALFCGWDLADATVKGNFRINPGDNDDDFVGFMWGLQDTDHFYIFHWKRGAQASWCNNVGAPAGMMVKKVAVDDPAAAPQSCVDVHQNASTTNSELLVAPADFYAQGWQFSVDYEFELTHKSDGEMHIVVRNLDNNTVVAEKTFMDTTYPSGKFGMYTYSQINACFSDYKTFCL